MGQFRVLEDYMRADRARNPRFPNIPSISEKVLTLYSIMFRLSSISLAFLILIDPELVEHK